MAEPQNTIHRVKRSHLPGKGLTVQELLEAAWLLDQYRGRAEARQARELVAAQLEVLGYEAEFEGEADDVGASRSTVGSKSGLKLWGAVLAVLIGIIVVIVGLQTIPSGESSASDGPMSL